MSNDKNQHDELDNLNEALSRSELFLLKHQKQIWAGFAVVIVLVGLVLAARYFYWEPRNEKAQVELATGIRYFEQEDYATALAGDSLGFMGLEAVADKYGCHEAGNLANAYAGVAAMRNGEFEKALDYLKDFDADDKMIAPVIVGAVGDCLVELDKVSDAVSYFEKAAKNADNAFLTPLYLKKAALAYEALNDNEAALEAYTTIKKQYPQSMEAQDIDKYIERVKMAK